MKRVSLALLGAASIALAQAPTSPSGGFPGAQASDPVLLG